MLLQHLEAMYVKDPQVKVLCCYGYSNFILTRWKRQYLDLLFKNGLPRAPMETNEECLADTILPLDRVG